MICHKVQRAFHHLSFPQARRSLGGLHLARRHHPQRVQLSQRCISTTPVCSHHAADCCSKEGHDCPRTCVRWETQSLEHAPSEAVLCHRLSQRALVRVAGTDTISFLQGLLTNDLKCLEGTADCLAMEGKSQQLKVQSLYAMMLNVKGRLLYDLIVYDATQHQDNPVYLIEVDSELLPDFVKTLKMYKIRKKVDVASVSDELSVWTVLPETEAETTSHLSISLTQKEHVVTAVSDPRLRSFSHRLILPAGISGSDVVPNAQLVADENIYHRRRHLLGIAEGRVELPPGECLPLECNAVFLNGVSFNKGCYIGQELTARTHHTGVIRKRIMPIILKSDDCSANPGDKMENAAGKNCGKFRNALGRHGLALLRLGDVVGKGDLVIKNSDGETVAEHVTTHIPYWWPRDSDEIVKQVLAVDEKLNHEKAS